MAEALVSLRFLGSGDAFGSGGRFQTCIQLRARESNVLVDCGASSLIAMRRFGVSPADIDAILLTHLHGDHFGGIPFFILDAQFFSPRERPLVIAGPPGVETRVFQAMESLFPGSSHTPQKFEIRFVEWQERTPVALAGARITPFPVEHASGAPPFALRIEVAGKTVAYSGDTEWAEALAEAAHGADLFICEAYFFDKKVRFHLDYRTLTANRERLGCRRLILTHMNADMLAHLSDVDDECAFDGLELTL